MISIFAKNKVLSIVSVLAVLAIVISGYCLFQIFQYNHYAQNKFGETDIELTHLSDWLAAKEPPEVFTFDDHERVFTFDHIGDVGWTRIIQNGVVNDSLGFYTNHIDPILTPLTANTLIGSAWQWPQDNKLYNGPFFNYFLDFRSRKTTELATKGKLMAKSNDGNKVVFIESECVKNPNSLEIDHGCNNQNLSLRLLNLNSDLTGKVIDHYNDIKLLDFNQVVFSPQGDKLAIAAKIESVDYDTVNEYWTLFVADANSGEIIKQNNRLMPNRYSSVYWIDNQHILYW